MKSWHNVNNKVKRSNKQKLNLILNNMLSCKINDQRVPLDPHVISNVVKPCIIKSLFYLFTADLVVYNHGNTHYTTFFYSNLHFFGFLRHICVFCKKILGKIKIGEQIKCFICLYKACECLSGCLVIVQILERLISWGMLHLLGSFITQPVTSLRFYMCRPIKLKTKTHLKNLRQGEVFEQIINFVGRLRKEQGMCFNNNLKHTYIVRHTIIWAAIGRELICL